MLIKLFISGNSRVRKSERRSLGLIATTLSLQRTKIHNNKLTQRDTEMFICLGKKTRNWNGGNNGEKNLSRIRMYTALGIVKYITKLFEERNENKAKKKILNK